MIRFLFISLDSRDYFCWPNESCQDAPHIEERTVPKGTSDWEVLTAARSEERDREALHIDAAGEHPFTRKPGRVIQIARELDLTAVP